MASFLASASVCLPVVLLVLVGTATPSASSRAANFGFDASEVSSTPSLCSNSSRFSFSSSMASVNMLGSSTSTGRVYIFKVMSISRNSFDG